MTNTHPGTKHRSFTLQHTLLHRKQRTNPVTCIFTTAWVQIVKAGFKALKIITNLVLKPSNRAVNHDHYLSSHQGNSDCPNTANYCSCWLTQAQNRTTSCQLHALTTVIPPSVAAIEARALRQQQRLSLHYLPRANLQRCPRTFPLGSNHPESRGKFSQTNCLDNLQTRDYCAVVFMD